MKNIFFSVFAILAVSLTSCSYDRSPEGSYDPNHPGFEYAPEGDMYHSVPYDPLSQFEDNSNPYNRDSVNVRLPAKGTIARNKLDYYYPFENSPQGYEQSVAFRNPVSPTPATLAEGKRLYEIYCWQCHGRESDPKGSLIAQGKFPNPTWAFDKLDLLRTLPEGKMFHAITFGKNLMGPHGFIVEPQQRWMMINYLKSAVQGNSPETATPAAGNTAPAATDTNNAAVTTQTTGEGNH